MKIGRSAAIVAAALVGFAASAAAASLVPEARIARTGGAVTVKYAGTGDFVSVWRHEKVGPGDTVRTGPEGTAELTLPDGGLVGLGGGSELTFEAIEPRRTTDDETGKKRVVLTARLRLTAGRARVVAGPGSLVILSAGRAHVATDPAAGADVTAALDVFATGPYLRVARGCAFVPLRDGSRVLPVCGDGRVRVDLFADRLTPLFAADSYTESVTVGLSGTVPSIDVREEAATGVTLDGSPLSGVDGTFRVPPGPAPREGGVTVAGTAKPGWVALVSPDNGTSWVTVAPDDDGRWRYRLDPAPRGGAPFSVKTMSVGPVPRAVVALSEPTPAPPAEETAQPEKGTVDPDEVAFRFVQAFSSALSRGDTGALSGLVSSDYNGAAGGTSRSALLRGVSEFFRGGGTLTVSAYAGGASLTDDIIIVTMTFSSRVSGAAKTGNLKLWLTAGGKLTHSEGEWVF